MIIRGLWARLQRGSVTFSGDLGSGPRFCGLGAGLGNNPKEDDGPCLAPSATSSSQKSHLLPWQERVRGDETGRENDSIRNSFVCIRTWGAGTSLMVQWLRLCVPNVGGPGLIPYQGPRSHMPQQRSKIPQAATETWSSQIRTNKQVWVPSHWLWGKPAADHKTLKQSRGRGTEAFRQPPTLTHQAYVWVTYETDNLNSWEWMKKIQLMCWAVKTRCLLKETPATWS